MYVLGDQNLKYCFVRSNIYLFSLQVYLGEQYVNNPTLSDVTFLVEGGEASLELFSLVIILNFVPIMLCFFLYQVNGSMLTEFVYLLPLISFVQCLMVVTG